MLNKKLKPNLRGYDVYSDQSVDEYGNISKKEVLSKYDEEIHGTKSDSFALGNIFCL